MTGQSIGDPVQAEVDSIDSAELAGDCAAVLDELDAREALTAREVAERVRSIEGFGIDTELRVEAALQQLRRDGCAEYASWSSAWWATR